MKVEILCQGEYGDSYESRIYYETNVSNLESAFMWIKERINDINDLDSIHGGFFWAFIDGQRVGCIDKYSKAFELYKDGMNNVILDIVAKAFNFKP